MYCIEVQPQIKVGEAVRTTLLVHKDGITLPSHYDTIQAEVGYNQRITIDYNQLDILFNKRY
jgi:hypothetical protein